MRKKEVNACSIQQWYPLFVNLSNKARKRVTLPCKWIELPTNFVHEFLLSDDSIILPPSVLQSSSTRETEWESDIDGKYEDPVQEQNMQQQFSTELLESIQKVQHFIESCLEEYDGEVFPKCNWSAPKDATFMLFHQSLKCQSVEDVFLVLRSSDFTVYDMEKVYEGVENAQNEEEEDVPKVLALKPFYDVNPSMEFRCFIFEKKIVGISQRDPSHCYSFLKSNSSLYESCIQEFYDEYVRDVFPLENYTMDVYINKKQQCFIVDFNVWGEPTVTLLYDSFKELEELASSNPDTEKMRIVQDSKQIIRPTISQYHGLPIDMYNTSIPTHTTPEQDDAQQLVALAQQHASKEQKKN